MKSAIAKKLFAVRARSQQMPKQRNAWQVLIAAGFGASTLAAYAESTVAESTTAMGAKKIETVDVIGQRLDDARNTLAPETGSSVYRFDSDALEALPLGETTPLNQVVLQAPGVVQDSYGQLHVRGDHANVQYRINEVVIPEPISGFGQVLDTRFADQINFLTGALPAQYGYRTAGVVDIHTKGTGIENGGSISYLGGSNNHQETSVEVGGSKDAFTYFLTGSYLSDNMGIENPTSARAAHHDDTKQGKGFGYLSYIVDPDSRLSFIFGLSNSHFEIPNVPGQTPSFMLDGAAPLNSLALDANQNEKNSFQIISYQHNVSDTATYLVSIFHRYTDVHYSPDPIGDLEYNGIASTILRKNESAGLQSDASYKLGNSHTLRAGVYYSGERFTATNAAQVFAADADGNQLNGMPLDIFDKTTLSGDLWGIYLQDEWQLSDALTLNYGTRYDKTNTVVDEQQLSPRVGLVYDLTPQTRLHAGYSRYFTPPPTESIDTTSVQKFQGTTNALPSDANTAVKSERSHYFDAGISQQLSDAITVGVDAYYRKVENLQDEGQFGNALIYSAFNFKKGRIRGLELSSSYRDDDFNAYANVALSKAEGTGIRTGQFNFDPDELNFIDNHWVHLDHDQTVSGSAGVSYRWQQTTFGTDLLYGSGLRNGFANSEHLPAYTQVNLSALHTFNLGTYGTLDGRVAMLNVFDRSYQLRDGSGIGVGAPQFGPRREIYFGVSKSF
ncbi:MAG TPA: TonB-dependent receptor [Spongiibacteraceae bacterium]